MPINPDDGSGQPIMATSGGGDGSGLLNAVGLVVSGIGSMYAANQSRTNTDHNIQAAKDQAEYAYSKDLEMWNRQNDYNSPVNQMARLKAAGLNPNMIYGSGSGGASGNAAAAQMPHYNAPTLNYDYKPAIDLPSMLGAYQNFRMQQVQIDNAKAQRRFIDAQTANALASNPLIGLKGQKLSADVSKSQADTRVSELKGDQMEMLRPYQAQIFQNLADSSGVKLKEEMQKFTLLSQQEQMNSLEMEYKRANITGAALQNEGRQADNLFKAMQNQWMKAGITSGDNPILRMLVRMYNAAGLDMDKLFGN